MQVATTIIGTGLAGYTVARELRKLSKDLPLRLICADSGAFYSKPMLSNALTANKTAAQLALKNAARMAEELNAEVVADTRVEALRLEARQVQTADSAWPYSQLVLALGADPVSLSLAGAQPGDVLSINDLGDYDRFRTRLVTARRVILLGAGLIGCEFANDLASAGFEVTVVDPAAWPLSRLLPEEGGRFLQARLEQARVQFRWGVGAQAIEAAGNGAAANGSPAKGYRLTLTDQSVLEADLVVSAVGLRPRTALASAAGLQVGRGIAVDRTLRSSDPRVFALGDCAEVGGLVLPFVLPIMQCARALAATLTGTPVPVNYPAMPVVVKTPACPAVVSPPLPGALGQWHTQTSAQGCEARFESGGQLLGFALLGDAVARKQELAANLPPWLPVP